MADRAISVWFASPPSRTLSRVLRSFAQSTRSIPGVIDAVPGYRSVLIEVDTTRIASVERAIMAIDFSKPAAPGPVHHIKVTYDGPDFDWVCRTARIDREELVTEHSSRVYDVCLIGSPGFIYLSPVSRGISVPRLERPRPLVPQGSVGIAGRQTGIYGTPRPGGWRIIGTVESVPPVAPGDRVAFQR